MPTVTYKQGYNDRLDESLGNKHKGPHSQSLKDRRNESKAMEKKIIVPIPSSRIGLKILHHFFQFFIH